MKKITGTYDVFGQYGYEFRKLEDYLYSISQLYNFEYIKTPIIESYDLYHREQSNTDDNVNKHTYDFSDLSGKQITLRPECNSGIARMILENKLYIQLPSKFYYYGDVFRYDKPQKDRYREFTQFGFENIGSNNPIVDADMISLAYNIYQNVGINNIDLKLNTLGSIDDIKKYRNFIIEYFSKYIDTMCDDCKRRLIENPIRIFDCKDKNDQEIIASCSKFTDIMSKDSLLRFEKVLKLLDTRKIPYNVDKKFIRGIDYQNDTIFEIIDLNKKDLSQNSLCGGGRYNNLYKYLINKDIPAFGFDFGLERFISSIKEDNPNFFKNNVIDLFIVMIDSLELVEFELIDLLRQNGITVEYDPRENSSTKSQLKFSDRYNAKYTLFLGNNEVTNNKLSLRNNSTGEKENIGLEDLILKFKEKEKIKCLKK